MRVALASQRTPKIDAVRAALARLTALEAGTWGGAELVTRATPSGVPDTPLHDAELQRGALQRARALAATLHAEGAPADIALGLEGGVHVEDPYGRVWLRSWCYAWDGARGAFGCGPSLELPRSIVAPVLRGEDLAVVIDRVAGGTDLRSAGGTWGWVTRGVLSRALAFESAVLAALVPFYHPRAFASEEDRRGADRSC